MLCARCECRECVPGLTICRVCVTFLFGSKKPRA